MNKYKVLNGIKSYCQICKKLLKDNSLFCSNNCAFEYKKQNQKQIKEYHKELIPWE